MARENTYLVLLKAQKGKCAECKARSDAFEIDHIVPRARGGSNHRVNLQLLCPKCNRRKSDHLALGAQFALFDAPRESRVLRQLPEGAPLNMQCRVCRLKIPDSMASLAVSRGKVPAYCSSRCRNTGKSRKRRARHRIDGLTS